MIYASPRPRHKHRSPARAPEKNRFYVRLVAKIRRSVINKIVDVQKVYFFLRKSYNNNQAPVPAIAFPYEKVYFLMLTCLNLMLTCKKVYFSCGNIDVFEMYKIKEKSGEGHPSQQ